MTLDASSLSVFGHGTSLYRGTISRLTVIDARGSLAGWRTTVSLASVRGLSTAQLAQTKLCIDPDTPTMVSGNPSDVVRAAPGSCTSASGELTVFRAASGGGGGTYADTAGLLLELPGPAVAGDVSATLSISVR